MVEYWLIKVSNPSFNPWRRCERLGRRNILLAFILAMDLPPTDGELTDWSCKMVCRFTYGAHRGDLRRYFGTEPTGVVFSPIPSSDIERVSTEILFSRFMAYRVGQMIGDVALHPAMLPQAEDPPSDDSSSEEDDVTNDPDYVDVSGPVSV